MRFYQPARAGAVLLLLGAVACSDDSPTAPISEVDATNDAQTSSEVVYVSPALASINARLASDGAPRRIARAEVIWDAKSYDAASPTLVFANNRDHKLAYSWVPGDPRRSGRVGVTYAIDPSLAFPVGGGTWPTDFDDYAFSQAELEDRLEESMSSWRARTCSDAPIERVPAGANPDFLDELILGQPIVGYAQPADIVQGGWPSPAFFNALAPGGAGGIIGVAFTFVFVGGAGEDTDIDGNGRLDTELVEIYYNPNFYWNDGGTGPHVDFYSIITHETGHALGLAHFGKVFVTKKDGVDGGGISLSEIKYAPKALMNAVYVTGRDEIAGTDAAAFCQLWASAN